MLQRLRSPIAESMKGQIVSIDMVLALVIFATALGGVLYTESTLSSSANDLEEFRRTQDRLIELSDQLVLTKGEPDGWYNTSKIKSIGLSYRDHRLADDKVLALTRMTHRDLQNNLSTGPNSVYIQLLTSTGANCTVRSDNITIGSFPSSSRERLSIDRLVMTEDLRNCTLRLTLWRS